MTTNRDETIAKLESQLDEWNAALGRMESSTRRLGRESRDRIDERVEDLKQRVQKNRERLEEIRRLSDEAWSKLQESVHDVWETLTRTVKDVEKDVSRHLEEQTTIENPQPPS